MFDGPKKQAYGDHPSLDLQSHRLLSNELFYLFHLLLLREEKKDAVREKN
jgi:hypothetical protein